MKSFKFKNINLTNRQLREVVLKATSTVSLPRRPKLIDYFSYKHPQIEILFENVSNANNIVNIIV